MEYQKKNKFFGLYALLLCQVQPKLSVGLFELFTTIVVDNHIILILQLVNPRSARKLLAVTSSELYDNENLVHHQQLPLNLHIHDIIMKIVENIEILLIVSNIRTRARTHAHIDCLGYKVITS